MILNAHYWLQPVHWSRGKEASIKAEMFPFNNRHGELDKSLYVGAFFFGRNTDLVSGTGSKLMHTSRCYEKKVLRTFDVECCEPQLECAGRDYSGGSRKVEIGWRSANAPPTTRMEHLYGNRARAMHKVRLQCAEKKRRWNRTRPITLRACGAGRVSDCSCCCIKSRSVNNWVGIESVANFCNKPKNTSFTTSFHNPIASDIIVFHFHMLPIMIRQNRCLAVWYGQEVTIRFWQQSIKLNFSMFSNNIPWHLSNFTFALISDTRCSCYSHLFSVTITHQNDRYHSQPITITLLLKLSETLVHCSLG